MRDCLTRAASNADDPGPVPAWPRGLLRPEAFAHEVGELRLIETHISWVILTGRYAYKIKKPLDWGFLDYSTLELRKAACEAELALNRRFAPELYLDVVPIRGSAAVPDLRNGDGAIVDYAVRMREFPQDWQLDRLLACGVLDAAAALALGDAIAGWHGASPVARVRDISTAVLKPALDNFDVLDEAGPLAPGMRTVVARLQIWTARRGAALAPRFEARRLGGYMRDLHGDLHLANLVRLDGKILPFDCIEFSATLRAVDVYSDLAFLLMDLGARGHDDLAYLVLDRYLERSGDYEGLRTLPFYLVYRALVRAKVALLRARQSAAADADASVEDACRYLRWADACAGRRSGGIVLMHGLSGSGKSWVSQLALAAWPAIRVRSDVERRRLFGVAPTMASGSGVQQGIYDGRASARTYARLVDAARAIVAADHTAIIDASFLRRADRETFAALASELAVPLRVLSCDAAEAVLDQRVAARAVGSGDDPSEAGPHVLAWQRLHVEPLDASERAHSLALDTACNPDQARAALLRWARSWDGHDGVAEE